MKTDSQEMVYELNERLFELLSRAGLSPWDQLDAGARKQVARLPFLVAEVHFLDLPWWLRVCGLEEGEPVGRAGVRLPREIAEPLMLEVLMFAWHEALADRKMAVFTVGMTPEISGMLAQLSAHRVREVAAAYSGEVAMRWMDMTDIWKGMAEAARQADEKRLSLFHLHAKLLLMGTLRTTSQFQIPRRLDSLAAASAELARGPRRKV